MGVPLLGICRRCPALGVRRQPEFLAEPDPVFDWLVAFARDEELRTSGLQCSP
jgi:hypothetical protein